MAERAALSRQIAADLSALIRSGALRPGTLLPSERELIQRYGTSKSTASKAIALLAAEGLVTTELGRGTFVRSRRPLRRVSAAQRHAEHRSSGKPIFDTEAIAQGQVPSRQMLLIGRGQASPDAAMWLQAAPGDEVVIRKRLHLLRLGAGIPIVQMWDVDYDEEGRTLQAAEDLYAADRHEFSYEWDEGDISP